MSFVFLKFQDARACTNGPISMMISSVTWQVFCQLNRLSLDSYCQRRCALVLLEQIWSENLFTAEGRILHEKVDSGVAEHRAGVRIERGMALRSFELGLSGKSDVVEFHQEGNLWRPYPVEYKHGRPKKKDCDRVQLCAQAICLEEMLGQDVPEGAIFYGKTRRRENVIFDKALRDLTHNTAEKMHRMISSGRTPPPVFNKQCEHCSLFDMCRPRDAAKSVAKYIKRMTADEETP